MEFIIFSPANLILITHVLFVAVVIFSVPLIILGGLLKWRWVCNPWFRIGHLLMIAFVAGESVIGMRCPLTVWENALRAQANESGYGQQDFIAVWLDRLLFYQLPHWVFTVAYISFGLLIAGLFYFVPVKKINP